MKKFVYYALFSIRQIGVYICSALIPKNKKLWVFGSWEGMLYADNSKYLYEYVKEQHSDIKCIWLTKNQEIYTRLKPDNEIYMFNSIKGFWALMRAGAVFETEGNKDIGGFILARTKVIQLWHGVAPKKHKWNEGASIFKLMYYRFFLDNHTKSYWMFASDENKKTFNALVGSRLDRSYETGYPRCDVFYRGHVQSTLIRKLREEHPNSKLLIYMPTHRNFGTEGVPFSEKELMQLDATLRRKGYVIVFKPHFHELSNYLKMRYPFSNIVFASGEEYSDVYSYIGDFDMLISDYSSIIYDFLCVHKPIVLFPFDLEKYSKKDAGLQEEYYSIPAGPFAYSWDEVISSAEQLFLGNAEWNEKRERCRIVFHPYEDGNNCERVYKAVRAILKT